jgi:hypothetical protein
MREHNIFITIWFDSHKKISQDLINTYNRQYWKPIFSFIVKIIAFMSPSQQIWVLMSLQHVIYKPLRMEKCYLYLWKIDKCDFTPFFGGGQPFVFCLFLKLFETILWARWMVPTGSCEKLSPPMQICGAFIFSFLYLSLLPRAKAFQFECLQCAETAPKRQTGFESFCIW